jgi:spore coat protein A
VQIKTGFATPLPGNGKIPAAVATESPQRALLMAPAERADIIVDFKGLSPGTRVRMINTAPDSPFGGFNGDPAADPATTGQVMEFVVGSDKGLPDDPSTKPSTRPSRHWAQSATLPTRAAFRSMKHRRPLCA